MLSARGVQRNRRSCLAPSLLLLLTLWLVQSSYCIKNNGKHCKEQKEFDVCSFGSFAPDQKCPNQYCLRGPGESCDREIPEMSCVPNLTCVCGQCMNCFNRDCRLLLCPNNLLVNMMRRFERNLIEDKD